MKVKTITASDVRDLAEKIQRAVPRHCRVASLTCDAVFEERGAPGKLDEPVVGLNSFDYFRDDDGLILRW
jgi:hypothetical protein